jgi:predicted membrane chloride channel (bestrophin family)
MRCIQRELVDREIAELSSTVGAAERIVRTTVPSSYSRHTSRFLTVWCFTLPLVLVVPLGWRMIPTITVICWALFTIEEVGHIIEDPFNMPSTNTADSLRLDRSFGGVREDVYERLPATGQGLDVNGGDVYISKDYDVTNFHDR